MNPAVTAGQGQQQWVESLNRDHRSVLRFPSADLVGAAAALFPVSAAGWRTMFGRVLSSQVWEEYASAQEGPVPFLEVGPGMVRFGRVDHARAERSRERVKAAGVAARALVDVASMMYEDLPMALRVGMADGTDGLLPDDRRVEAWSRKSRTNLIKRIASLDLEPLVTGPTPPVMVTLTLPGPWEKIAPDAATAAALLHTWAMVYESKWGKLRCIWKREFQRRGAPHWHLWMVLPTEDRKGFREWLSRSWVSVCKTRERCGEEHAARHLRAGTGVDVAEGLRARDPRRLALYFLKESLGGEGKAYQNAPPKSWEGQSVGRYWGVRGIPSAVERVALDPAWGHRMWRVMRKWRERSVGVQVVTVARADQQTGQVRYRKVRRRARIIDAGAGWVAVNDGPAFAAALARLADVLAADHAEVLRQFEEDAERRWLARSALTAGFPREDPAPDQGLSVQQRRDLALLERTRPRF